MSSLVLPSRMRRRPRNFEASRTSRGGRITHETLNFIPASMTIRPLRDQMIVEPLEVIYSRYILVNSSAKPMRGIVRAVGPGTYPKCYDHRDKHKRTKVWDSQTFVPCECKVGDIVHLGGLAIGGYSFEQFWWGDKIHLHCTERDVCGIET